MIEFVSAAAATFIGMFVVFPILLFLAQMLGIYTIVEERQCKVYVLFGKVVAILDQPGLHILWLELGPIAPIVNWLGKCHVLDLRLDQDYLRSQPVNSEEGAPMGIGVWYEMFVSDPVAYLFKNADPRGSLVANVSNATVRCLSNMRLGSMLENRHAMSQAVRDEVSPKSNEWGYQLGSVYIRKVHFRDAGMIRQIEEKVVNRLRQVTSAIRQDGANQVSVITSTAERQAAIEFAKARAVRPQIVGAALHQIASDPAISQAMFQVLETDAVVHSEVDLTLVPRAAGVLSSLISSQGFASPTNPQAPQPGHPSAPTAPKGGGFMIPPMPGT